METGFSEFSNGMIFYVLLGIQGAKVPFPLAVLCTAWFTLKPASTKSYYLCYEKCYIHTNGHTPTIIYIDGVSVDSKFFDWLLINPIYWAVENILSLVVVIKTLLFFILIFHLGHNELRGDLNWKNHKNFSFWPKFSRPPPPPLFEKGPTDENVGISYLIVIIKFGFFKPLPPPPISSESRTSPIFTIEVAP